MAINDTQKLDYLWKKLGYGLSKTDTNANKTATNESIASPLLLRGDNVWSQAQDIPAVKPSSSSGVVTVYPTSAPVECTADITASANRTWKTNTIDWIPVEIGSTYSVQVYVHTSGQASTAVSSGTRLFAAGSGNNDEWFFDYQSGVLHFIGTNLPNGINFTNKSVYIVGARYTGLKGVAAASGGAGDFQDVDASNINISGVLEVTQSVNVLGRLNVAGIASINQLKITGISTFHESIFIDSTKRLNFGTGVSDLYITHDGNNGTVNSGTGALYLASSETAVHIQGAGGLESIIATANSGVEIYHTNSGLATKKFETTTSGIDVTGLTDTDTLNVSGSSTIGGYVDINSSVDISTDINVGGLSTFVGVGTFGSHLYVGGNLSVDGTTDLDVLNVAELATFSGNIDANGNLDVDGQTDLDALNVAELATFSGNIDANGNLDVDGQTDLDVLNVAELATFSGNIDANGNLDVDGQTDLDHVAISGVSTFSNTIDANAGVDIAGTLDVAGQTTVNHVTVGGAITATTFTGNLDGTLLTAAQPNITSLGTLSAVTVSGLTDLNGDLDVDGHATLDNVTVGGAITATTFTGNLVGDVTGNITGNISGDITGTLQTAAQPNVTSLGTLTSLNVSGDLDVDGATTVDALTVAELATFSGNIDANGNLDVDGTSDLDTVNIAENLNVTGVSTFVGISSFYNDVNIDGDLRASAISLDNINSTGVVTATAFHTGAEGSAIRVTANTISGPAILTLDPAGVGDNTGKVVIAGDLQVDGTQTIVNSTAVTVNDLHIEVADGAANDAAANGAGIIVQSGEGNKSFAFEATGDNFGSSENLNLAAGKVYKIANTEVLSATQLSITSIVASDVTTSGLLDINAGAQANTFKVEDLTEDRIVIAGVGGELEDDASLTFNGTLLNVVGNINATGNLSADGNLDVDGTTDLDILNVAEIATFSANIDANGNLDVSGTTELDVLNVSQTATFTSNIVANADIDLAGSIDVDGHTDLDNVSVSGVTTFANTVKFGTNIDSNIVPTTDATYDLGSASNEWRDLHLDGIAYLDDVKVTNTLDVVGLTTIRSNTDINGHLDVSGITTLSTLRVTGLSTFTDNIDVNGHTELDDVNISGVSTFVGVGTFISHLYVAGTLFAPNFSVNGGASIGEDVTARDITATRNLTANGNLDVDGQTDLDHVAISGVSTFSGNIDANGDLDVDGQTDLDVLNVAELATFSGDIDANGALDVAGQTTANHVTVGGAITATTFTGNLDGTLLTAAQANITSLGTLTSLTVSGATDLNGALDVDGRSELDDVNVANTLNVVGVSTFAGIGTFGSHLYVAGTFSVDGQSELDALVVSELATFGGNIDANGDLDVDGTTTLDVTTIDGLLDVNAGAQINTLKVEDLTDNRIVIVGSGGELEDDANLTYDGTTLSVGGNLNLSGSIDVTTHTTLQHVTVGGAITATTFTGNLDGTVNTAAQPNITSLGVLSGLSIGGNLSMSGDLDVDGHTDLDNVTVGGAITATTFTGNLDGTLLTAAQANVTSLGTLTALNVSGDLDVDGHTDLDNVTVGGAITATTFTGNLAGNVTGVINTAAQPNITSLGTLSSVTVSGGTDLNGDLDVDGHTDLDNVDVSGVSTFASDVNVGGALSVTGNSFFVGMVTFAGGADGNIVLGNASTDNVVFNADVNSDIIPQVDDNYDLGSEAQQWKDLYLDGVAYLDEVKVAETLHVTGLSTFVGISTFENNLYVGGTLFAPNFSAGGGATIGEDVTTRDITASRNLDVDGLSELDDVNVGSALTVAGNIDANGDLDVDGQTDLDVLNVAELATFSGNIDANGDLDVDGLSELDDVNVGSALTVAGNIDANGDLDVDGHTNLDNVNVSGIATIGDVIIGGGTTDLMVNGSARVTGFLDIGTASIRFDGANNKINVGSALTLADNDGIQYHDQSLTQGGLDVNNVNVGTAITVAGPADLNGNLDVSGTSELTHVNVSGTTTATTVSATSVDTGDITVANTAALNQLTVAGFSTFTGVTTFIGDLFVTGNVEVIGELGADLSSGGISTFTDLVIQGDVDIDGQTDLDHVAISGVSTFTGAIVANGFIDANANIDVAGNLDVDGTTELDGLNVDGNTTLDTVTVSQAATLAGASFSGDIDANGNLDVDGTTDLDDTNIVGALTVTGNSTFNGNVDITGVLTYEDVTNVDSVGIATARVGLDVLSGGIDVTGISTFNNDLDVTGALDVDGATTVDALTVAELATFSGNIDANGNLDVDGISDLDDVKVANTLHVTGVSTFVGITTFSDNVFISGDLRASAIALDNINSTGVATATRFDGEIGKLGNTHYVATTGDDTNAGDNINEPFRTIVKALSVASSGDIIHIAAGEFEETCPMTVPAGVTVKGSGLRATTIRPTTATNTNNIFLVDNISTLEDFTIKGSFYNSSADTGYAFSFANNITISTRSPYIQRVTVLNRGSVTSTSDPYGFDTADSAPSSYQAGRGALVDGSKVTSNSIEAGMLFNEVTFFTPNQKGVILTNGARAEYLNCFHYFASQAIVGQVGTTGIGGNAGARLKLNNPGVTPAVNDIIKLFNGGGVGIATGTVTAYSNNYATISGLGIGTFVSSGSSQDVRIYQNDGVTQRGTADNITLADYTMFGAEMRSVGCAVEYGTQGVVADGNGVKLRMFATNFNHVGSGKDFTNDDTLTIQANEVTELNLGQVSFVSIDQHGDFRVGDSLLIDQETGNVAFAATTQNINITGELDVTDGSVTSTLSPTTLTVGSMVIGGNTISSSSGNITIDPSGSNKTIIQGDLGVVGILTANVINVGAFQKGDTSIAITDTGTDGTIVFSTDNTEAFRVNNTQQIVFAGDAVANSHLKVTGVSTFAAVTGTTITASTGFVGNVVGDLEGNADTATTLETSRTIAGKSFNGSANITIAAQDLSDVDQDLATTDNVQFARVTAPLTGNVTGNVTGNLSGSVLTSAQTNITSLGTLSSVVVSGLADLNGDLDVDGHTDLDNVTVGGAITATTFTGALDGNATTATTAGTVTTAAQPNITSLGTLSAVTVSGFADLNGDLDVDGHTTLDHVTVGGAITATTFTGDLDGVVLGSTHPNITTIGTLTSLVVGGNADLDGDLDVDGHTNLDNVSISGIVTSTNGFVGALTGNADTATTAGTVTTAAQPNITSVGTLSALTVSGTIDANGNLDVDGTTDLDVLNVAEIATFSGNIDANGNLDVDGTTDLDVLNVAETATFSSNIDANGNLDVDGRSELDDVNIANTLNVVGVSTFATILSVENVSSSGVITATTFSGNVVATTISGELTGDVNGNVIGNLNGIVGATTPAAVTGTTITANTGFVGNLTGNVTGTVSDISNHDTDNLSEGSNNLYYTDARADARADLKIAAATGANLSLSNKTTSDLAEGSNLYFTNARADARIASADTDDLSEGSTNLYFTNTRADARADARIAASDTDSLSEGSTNLYFTNARADARVDAGFTAKSTSDLSEGTNLYYTDARADVRVGAATGANLDLSSKNTGDLAEGSNLYFTNARADARISAASITDLSDADQGVATTDTPTFAGINVTGITTLTSLKSTALETTYTKNSSATLTTTATTQTSSVQIDASAYRSAEYLIQGTQGTKVHLTKLLAIHDGTTVYLTEYGTVHNGETLATFDVQIVAGQMTLLVTSASTTSTSYNISYTTIKV